MSALANVYEVRRKVVGSSGNAYTESAHPDTRDQIDQLVRTHTEATDGLTLASGFQELLTPPDSYAGFRSFPIDATSVREVSGDTALTIEPGIYVTHEAQGAIIVGGGGTLATPYGQLLIWPEGAEEALFLEPGWLVFLPPGVTALSIMMPDGDIWMRGFRFDSVPGLLWFRDDPFLLFPGKKIIAATERKSKFKGAYSLGIEATPYRPSNMISYARVSNDINTLYKAAAEAMDLGIAQYDGIIHKKDTCEQGAIYYTAYEEICAKYPHVEKAVGDSVSAGEVIGGVNVLQITSSENWQTLNWDAGLSLDGLCAVDGLQAENDLITLNFNGSGNPEFDSLTEIVPGAQAALNAITAPIDTAQGNPVMNYYGESPGGSIAVNALQLFLELCPSVIVDYAPVFFSGSRLTRLKKFLTKETPLGLNIIYREI